MHIALVLDRSKGSWWAIVREPGQHPVPYALSAKSPKAAKSEFDEFVQRIRDELATADPNYIHGCEREFNRAYV